MLQSFNHISHPFSFHRGSCSLDINCLGCPKTQVSGRLMVGHFNSIQLMSVCLDYVKENLEAWDSIMQVFKDSPLQAGLEFSIHKPAWVVEGAGPEHKLRPRTDEQCRHS